MTLLGQDAPGSHAHRENGRLGVFRELEVFFRPLEDEFGERKAERFIGFGKGIRGHGKMLCEVAAHANGLRTLARKEKGNSGRHFNNDLIALRRIQFQRFLSSGSSSSWRPWPSKRTVRPWERM
jgi:hypothetical protein